MRKLVRKQYYHPRLLVLLSLGIILLEDINLYTIERGYDNAERDPGQLIHVSNLCLTFRHPGSILSKFNSS